jgi:translation elongation factor EF-1beta
MQLTEKQQQAVAAYERNNCSEGAAARELGIDPKSVKGRLYDAIKKGYQIQPDRFVDHAPVGFGLTKSTIQVNAEGEVVQRWDRVSPLEQNIESVIEFLKERIPAQITIPKPKKTPQKGLCLEWTLADFHYGLLAWDKESGEDYDMNIARDLLLESATEILDRSGVVEKIVLVLMGDNFHSDFFNNLTEASKHSLSVDSRYPKVVYTGVEVFMSAIEACLNYADTVDVVTLYGNHDKQTSINLQLILYYAFRNNPRVKIDLGVMPTRYNIWGVSATAYHHGDGTKPGRLCSDIVRYVATNDIPGVREFYAKQAHLHKELVQDIDGVTYEIVMSPVARDGHASKANYQSKRATIATIYDKDFGQLDRFQVATSMLARKKLLLQKVTA